MKTSAPFCSSVLLCKPLASPGTQASAEQDTSFLWADRGDLLLTGPSPLLLCPSESRHRWPHGTEGCPGHHLCSPPAPSHPCLCSSAPHQSQMLRVSPVKITAVHYLRLSQCLTVLGAWTGDPQGRCCTEAGSWPWLWEWGAKLRVKPGHSDSACVCCLPCSMPSLPSMCLKAAGSGFCSAFEAWLSQFCSSLASNAF